MTAPVFDSAIAPEAIVARYTASGDKPDVISDLTLIQGLLALSPADRLAWGIRAAKLFPVPAAPADLAPNAVWTPSENSVDSIVGITREAEAFLIELSTGFGEYVGSWKWDGVSPVNPPTNPPAVTEKPQVVSVSNAPPSAPAGSVVFEVKHQDSLVQIIGKDLHEAFEKVAAFFRSLGHSL